MQTFAMKALIEMTKDKSGVISVALWRRARWSGNANPALRFKDGSYLFLTRQTANMAKVGQSLDGATWDGRCWVPDNI